MAKKQAVFVHGAWVTRASWDTFRQPFEAAGWEVLVPTWPLLGDATAAEIRANPPEGLGALSVKAIADHYEAYIRTLDEPPLLIGHSFGGLLTQILLDRGLGRAGIVLNPVPIGGFIIGPTTLSFALKPILRWKGWSRTFNLDPKLYAARYANSAPPQVQKETWEAFVIPTPGRIFYDAAFWIGTLMHPKRRTQPLLITGSQGDRLVTPYLSRSAYAIQRKAPASTVLKMYPRLSHLLIAEPGWEDIAKDCLDWAEGLEA